MIQAGTKVATVSDLSTVWVLLNIHEKDLAQVEQESTVKIHPESYPGEVLPGKVAYIGDSLIRRAAPFRYASKCLIPGALKPGMFATAEVVTGNFGSSDHDSFFGDSEDRRKAVGIRSGEDGLSPSAS